jgi:beta-N-acetylhexosaminidase
MRRSTFWLCLSLGLAAAALSACRSASLLPRLAIGPSETRWVNQTLSRMTLEQKVGQLIGIRCNGRFFNREDSSLRALQNFVVKRHVGSLILFGGNVYETAFLTNALQSLASVPLLIASDFERGAGGQVDGATAFPPLMALGAIDSEETAYAMGRITALEGRAMGVHLTYAPVMDVNINPDNPIINTRSVGENPAQVGRLGKAFIRGCQDNGLLATAKHFPGHGDTEVDSHIALAAILGDRERLERVELAPFRQAIDAGVHAVMVSHLAVPALDPVPHTPATLSPAIVTGLLRGRLGFQGLIVSDAMEMGGITTLYPAGEAAVKAVQAGIDLILLPADADQAIDALIQAVRAGAISRQRLDESVRRILTSKAGLGLHKNKLVDPASLDERVAAKESVATALKAFENAVTLVKNDGPVLPLAGDGRKLAVFMLSSDPGDYFVGRPMAQEIAKRLKNPEDGMFFYAEAFTGQEYIDEALAKAKSADTVIVGLFSRVTSGKGSADISPGHVQAVKKLVQAGAKVVAVSFGSPYFLRHFPEVRGYVCAYRQSAEAQAAAVKALFGEIEVRGKLPVSLPDLYPRGRGLTLSPKNQQ